MNQKRDRKVVFRESIFAIPLSTRRGDGNGVRWCTYMNIYVEREREATNIEKPLFCWKIGLDFKGVFLEIPIDYA